MVPMRECYLVFGLLAVPKETAPKRTDFGTNFGHQHTVMLNIQYCL
jgi:hypothetical protein